MAKNKHHCRICGYRVDQAAIDKIMADSTEGPASWGLSENDVAWFHVDCAKAEGHEPIPEEWAAYWAER